MFSARLATGITLLVVVVSALLFLPNRWWNVLLIPVLAGASWEWSRLAHHTAGVRWVFCALVPGSAIALWLGAGPETAAILLTISCAFWFFIAPAWLVARRRVQSGVVLTLTGWIVLVPAWFALGRLQVQPAQLLALLAIVWLADTGAYAAGRAWGKHKLAATISPGKTWEGVAGAAFAVAVYYAILSHAVPEWGWWANRRGMVLFAGVTFLSIMGDLFESWMKRQAGAKDSGTLLPGHGGILDRVDSMTSSMPFAAAFLLYMN